MSNNRPFLSSFLAAFRAHSTPLSKTAPSLSTSTASTTGAVSAAAASAQTVWSSSNAANPSGPRTIHTKAGPGGTVSAAAASQQQQQQQQSQAATLSPLHHNVSPRTHSPRSPPSPGSLPSAANGAPVYGPQNKPQPSYPTVQEARRQHAQSGGGRNRRGSDSSSDGGAGFRDVMGGEKWYIGGRTAGGEERFYKLSMVKRERSADRLSADRLSL